MRRGPRLHRRVDERGRSGPALHVGSPRLFTCAGDAANARAVHTRVHIPNQMSGFTPLQVGEDRNDRPAAWGVPSTGTVAGRSQPVTRGPLHCLNSWSGELRPWGAEPQRVCQVDLSSVSLPGMCAF